MTERVGLLGWPVEHSVSAAMHNAAFASLGLDWRYELLPVSPEKLGEGVRRWLDEGYRGFNVTIPHKQAVLDLPLIATVSPAAQAIGAANTLISTDDGTLVAENTDWQGFLRDLFAHEVDPADQFCLLLGTGGSSRAVAYALNKRGAGRVLAVSRQPDEQRGMIGYDALAHYAPQADLIVNCTPVGMHPDVDASPWPEDVAFPSDAVLVDLIYNPLETALMRQAKAAGARAFNGLGMLVWQGALAFDLWTEQLPSVEVMTGAAHVAMGAW